MSNQALIKQRTGGKSLQDLDLLEAVVHEHPGYTMTQASWVAAGGTVDGNGYCQPAELFNQCLRFFNFKRRGSEAAFMPAVLGDHPKARFKYGKATCNPYDFGGAGVYPLRPVAAAVSRAVERDAPAAEPRRARVVDVGAQVAAIRGLLD